MWNQFFLENIHFALNIFAALVFFATMWLYLDAWLIRKTWKEAFKVLGLLLISISFVIHAAYVESTVVSTAILDNSLNSLLVALTRIPGYVFLIIGLLIDPLQKHPTIGSDKTKMKAVMVVPYLGVPVIHVLHFAYPILATIVAFLYLKRATVGLENHIKPVALSFYILAFYELLALSQTLQSTDKVSLYNLAAPFGPFWIAQHLVLFLGLIVLGKWIYYYLLDRLQSQLFMIFTVTVMVIFLVTTITFTGLLLKNLQDETLRTLETDVKVLSYAVESKKAEGLSDTQILSQNPQVIQAVEAKDKKVLGDFAQNFIVTKKQNSLVVVDVNGQVLARGEERERTGDSLSDDSLIKRSLVGESVSSVVAKDGALAPEVSVRAATPIFSQAEVIGAVMVATTIDNAFVDGIKEATKLEVSIYADNILSSTTTTSSDGKTRYIGIKEENEQLKELVLNQGESFSGSIDILNVPYFAAFLPLKDVDSNPVGMLFVGKPQFGVLQTAGKSIEFTFIVAALLLVLSVIPAYLISRYLAKQLR